MSTRHYFEPHSEGEIHTVPTACGHTGYGYGAVTDRSAVTCKRCLASLAKRDREFQRKARKWWKPPTGPVATRPWERNGWIMQTRLPSWPYTIWKFQADSARAIAREEGRA